MVEASILFKLLSASILDMCKVFEHIDMLSIDILSNSLKQFNPQYYAQIVGFCVTCGVNMMSLGHV
jgi:hypothetical protein